MVRPIIYGSVCSGIEAASVAWKPLGWKPAFFSEIEPFPRAVLKHHHAEVPLHGDFTTISAGQYDPIDLLVGGTPCQSFSIAGLRGGLDDDRGNLALEYLRLADRLRPRWLVWENVPGVLSSNGGRDFGSILGGMGELGYGFAYRVLDAQFFGLAQRRRRVFVVGYLGDWRRAAAVLFERHSLSGHPAPRRETGKRVARPVAGGSESSGGYRLDADRADDLIAPPVTSNPYGDHKSREGLLVSAFGGNNSAGPIDVSTALNSHGGPHGRLDFESETFIAHALRGEGFDASEDGTGRGTPLVPVTYSIMPMNSGTDYKARAVDVAQPVMAAGPAGAAGGNQGGDYVVQPIGFNSREDCVSSEHLAGSLGSSTPQAQAIAFALRGREGGAMPEVGGEVSNALRTPGGGASVPMIAFAENQRNEVRELEVAGAIAGIRRGDAKNETLLGGPAVRRLTPRECERLQGFQDDYTMIPWRGGLAPDGPRYKALGNSMAVPCMAWIGRRITAVEALEAQRAAA